MFLTKRQKITEENKNIFLLKIKELLENKDIIQFAYIHGSFVDKNEFNDVDIGIYLKGSFFTTENDILKYQLSLATELELTLNNGYEIDIRVLNSAPLSFSFAVITEGYLLFSKDKNLTADFESRVRDLYFDFLPHKKYYYRTVVLGEKK